MLTIKKLVAALESIRSYTTMQRMTEEAKLSYIFVVANETLKETAPEIETIKREAS